MRVRIPCPPHAQGRVLGLRQLAARLRTRIQHWAQGFVSASASQTSKSKRQAAAGTNRPPPGSRGRRDRQPSSKRLDVGSNPTGSTFLSSVPVKEPPSRETVSGITPSLRHCRGPVRLEDSYAFSGSKPWTSSLSHSSSNGHSVAHVPKSAIRW